MHAPTSRKGDSSSSSLERAAASGRQTFVAMALNMTWQLALAVLVPVGAGVLLDHAAGTNGLYTYIGLGLALVLAGVVMWRTMQVANKLPVPKLTAEQKRKVQQQYEEDDDDA